MMAGGEGPVRGEVGRRGGGWCAPVAALLLAVGSAACAHSTLDVAPGSDWKTIRSEHFLFHTDAAVFRAEPFIDRLEDVYTALQVTFFPGADVRDVEVMFFADDGDFDDLIGELGGIYIGSLGRQGGGLFFVRDEDGWSEALAHELAHRFIRQTVPRAPAWFHEGLATYVETVEVHDDVALFGKAANAGIVLGGGQFVPLAEVLAGGHTDFHGAWARAHYASAWAFIHFLMHGENNALRENFALLRQALATAGGTGDPTAEAMAVAFPHTTYADLDQRVRDYAVESLGRQRGIKGFGVRFARPPREAPREEPLDREWVKATCQALRRHGAYRR